MGSIETTTQREQRTQSAEARRHRAERLTVHGMTFRMIETAAQRVKVL